MEKGKSYESDALIGVLAKEKPYLSAKTHYWTLRTLVRTGQLVKLRRGLYSLPSEHAKSACQFSLTPEATAIAKLISKKFPFVQFNVFETVMMNEFLNHLIAQNTIFIQVEKNSSAYVFRFLHEKGKKVMYKPNLQDFHRYWSKGCIIVLDRISEAPSQKGKSPAVTLEGMLVDMLADRLLGLTYEKAEYANVLAQARENYLLDERRMLRYARRRNKENEIREYLQNA